MLNQGYYLLDDVNFLESSRQHNLPASFPPLNKEKTWEVTKALFVYLGQSTG